MSISAERRLRRIDEHTWEMQVEARNLIGRIRETTRFGWAECTPLTTRYSYLRQGFGQKREAQLTLDRQQNTASLQRTRGSDKHYAITADTTDKLSQTLALQCMLQRGDTELALDVADERGREIQHYRIEGEELLSTQAGPLRTLRIARNRDDDRGRETRLWFAIDHQYALVKLVQEEDNQRHEMVIRSL
jgi:hypothetical protein